MEDGRTSLAEAALGGAAAEAEEEEEELPPLLVLVLLVDDDEDDPPPSVVLLRFEDPSLPPLFACLSFLLKNILGAAVIVLVIYAPFPKK